MHTTDRSRSIYLEEQPPSDSKMNQMVAKFVHKSSEFVSVHFDSCISPPSLSLEPLGAMNRAGCSPIPSRALWAMSDPWDIM